MEFAAFVSQGADGQPYMGIQVMDGDIITQFGLCKNDNADDVIKHVIAGLKEARADLKRQASGLVVPSMNGLEVPNGFRRPQGRVEQGKSGQG